LGEEGFCIVRVGSLFWEEETIVEALSLEVIQWRTSTLKNTENHLCKRKLEDMEK
jgi:hypothetical protein